MKVELYIAGQRVDLSEDELILFNYTQEELDNPTYLKNSYSQTLTLAGTPTNNALFGELFRVDRETIVGGVPIDGAYFNATKKTPFQLFAETGEELASGYVKIDGIESEGGAVSYKVSLYGGLGSFFYDLSYDDNGDEMSLADLVYHDKTDTEIDLTATTLDITAANIYDLWQELLGSTSTFDWVNILNFAPCNNGVPKDFDAKKAIIGYTQFFNIPYVSGDFSWNSTAQGILVNMENNHDEWEMRDLRAYLQRPVLSVKEVLLAIQRTTTYDLVYDEDWFDASNPRYEDAWLTLPIYKNEEGDYTGVSLRDLIKGTMTPAAFLISYARTFGLVFKVEGERITVMKRSTYYAEQQNSVLDLTKRIDTTSISQKPFAFDAKWYAFGNTLEGAFATYYKDKYGRDYGEQRVNTGYEFDNSVKPLMDGLKFKGAVQALESSPLFRLIGKSGLQNFAPAYSEKITIRLYDNANNQSSDVEPLDTTYDSPEVEYNNDTYPFADFQDRPQFHDGEGKALDGSGVLLFYAGVTPLPTQTTFLSGFNYHLSDDDATALDLLNDGKPCWDIRGGFAHIQALSALPHFSRWLNELSMDFGVPSEIAVVGDSVLHNGIYTQRWSRYIADRYDDDSRVMTCKVDLRGWRVGQELLQRFYWYGGALWSLNKIINHSITTGDLTECEFIKVQDKANYTVDSLIYYLNVNTMNITLQDELTTTIEISSNDDWTISADEAWVTLSANSGSGNATITVSVSATSVDRTATITLVGDNVVNPVVINLTQLVVVEHFLYTVPTSLSWQHGDTTQKTIIVYCDVAWVIDSQPSWVSTTIVGNRILVDNDSVSTAAEGGNIVIKTTGGSPISTQVAVSKAAEEVAYTRVRSSDITYITTTFSRLGGSRTIHIESNEAWDLDITSDDDWLTANTETSISGSGDATISLRAVANTGVARTAIVRLKGASTAASTYTAKQAAASAYSLSVSPSSGIIVAKGGYVDIAVSSNDTWQVVIPAAASSWLTCDTVGQQSGNKTIRLTASRYYDTMQSREAYVAIDASHATDATVHIIQSAAIVYVLNTTPASAFPTIAQEGDSVQLTISTNDTWEVILPAWVDTDDATTGGTDGVSTTTTLTLRIEENTSGSVKSDDIIVRGAEYGDVEIAITQNAVAYAFDVTPLSFDVSESGGTISLIITSNDTWTITLPSAGWITAQGSLSGSGNATVVLVVAPNSGSQRSAYVTCTSDHAGGKNVLVNQYSGIKTLTFVGNDIDNPLALEVGFPQTVVLRSTDTAGWTISVPSIYSEYVNVSPLTGGQGDTTLYVELLDDLPEGMDIIYFTATSANTSPANCYITQSE